MTPHLTREELQRWWEHGSAADRHRIIEHLSQCDACGALYGEIVAAQAPMPELPAEIDRHLVERAYGVLQKTEAITPAARPWWSPSIALAAAAVLVAGIAVSVVPWPREPAGDDTAIRGSALQGISPVGLVAGPVRFAWSSPIRAAGYRVDVRDDSGDLVLRLSSGGASIVLDADRQARLRPGRTYQWTVVALDREGEEMIQTPPIAFVLAEPGR